MTARRVTAPAVGPVPPFQLYTIPEAARVVGVGTTWIYERLADGRLPAIQLGEGRSKQRIRADALAAYIDSLSYGTPLAAVPDLTSRRTS